MGQAETKRIVKHRTTQSDSHLPTPHRFRGVKTVLVHFGDKTKPVEIPDEHLTCGWLFSEVIRACSSPDSVVALRTTADIEIKDFWLTQYDRQLMLLKDQEELAIVNREEMPPILCKQQFQPLKVIGKGGFSKVLLGSP
jgi:hypothetical protein